MGQNSMKQGMSGRRAARERENAAERHAMNGRSDPPAADAEPAIGPSSATAPASEETATGETESGNDLFAFDGDYASEPSAAVEQRELEAAWPDAPVGAARAWMRAWTRGRVDAAVRWVRGLTVESWVWISILALATILRFWGLGDKPVHHDESMHAYFSLLFARDPASYVYDPLLHGPFQFHAEGIVFAVIIALSKLFHVSSSAGNPWINDATARILPATTGVALVGLTYGLRRQLGRIGAPIAAFLLAVSPTFVYFSRFLREDIYFACFTYATVVCAVQYAHKRTTRWLVAAALVFVLAYATLEAIYLNVAIWGSFLAIVVVWELGHTLSERLPRVFSGRERAFFGHAAPLLLLGAVGSAVALVGLHTLNQLSDYINHHTTQTDAQVAQLENATVTVLLYASMALALFVIGVLVKQIYYDMAPLRTGAGDAEYPDADDADAEDRYEPRPGWGARLAQRLDPTHQPFLRLVLSISWVSWFVAFVAGWVLFAALYWVVPGEQVSNIAQGFQVGVGKGIWQGLYYWLEQQQVARGGQPWYYYLLLIPLYEQLAVVFGLAGLVRALVRPTRFRLFLAYWFVASLALYSWAGEKMPWLALHILLPLMLLAAVALEGLAQAGLKLAGELAGPRWNTLDLGWLGDAAAGDALAFAGAGQSAGSGGTPVTPANALGGTALPASHREEPGASLPAGESGDMGVFERLVQLRTAAEQASARLQRFLSDARVRATAVALGLFSAVVLLVPMLYGMLVLSYHDAANGPHEMMVYVQTTTDVTAVMSKLTRADQLLYGGRHQLKIAVGVGEEWPFVWYLRDYALDQHPSTYMYLDYPVTNTSAPTEDILLLTPEDATTFMAAHPGQYRSHEYQLRSWWDEGYKPPPCVPAPKHSCSAASSWGSGVGPLLWLSYGDTPPPHARFNLGLAASRLWSWLWFRKPLGYANGSYDFTLVVRNGVPIQP